MPAFRSALSSRELEAVVAHTLRLAAPAHAAAARASPLAVALAEAGFVPAARRREAPALNLSDATGHKRTLAAERGQLVLLNFWGASCEHCIASMGQLQELADRESRRGVSVINICADSDDAETAQQIVDRVSPRTRAWIDTTGLANSQYDVQILPTIWLIDTEGRLLGSASGMRDWTSPGMQNLIAACLQLFPPE
jgi:peroxiredoxin